MRKHLPLLALLLALPLFAAACATSTEEQAEEGVTTQQDEETQQQEEPQRTPEELAAENQVPVPEGITLQSASEEEGRTEFKLKDSQPPRPDFFDQQMQAAGWELQESAPINSKKSRFTRNPCAVVVYLIDGGITVTIYEDEAACASHYNSL